MLNSNSKEIEDAFITIRADFEKRDNQRGLEFLNSIEEQWDVTGRLSDRQLAWLERQLDGSWKQCDAEPGKIVVDPEKLDQLEKAIDGLKRAINAMR